MLLGNQPGKNAADCFLLTQFALIPNVIRPPTAHLAGYQSVQLQFKIKLIN